EFRLGYGSWIAVLTTYAFGAVILVALVQFLIHLEHYRNETERVALYTQDSAALNQLLHELDSQLTRDEMGKTISRFESRYIGDQTERPATEFKKVYLAGNPQARIIELAKPRSASHTAAAYMAKQRLERSALSVKAY